ncbi:50S ribosomal protein L11 methyltransferase [Paenibacillus senegalensis]|uniref:50S ribosomal protein L11 methyltransferase n=1 Tax=Paenibacillus senegalensis TaxID=1465766 RepID=UPI000288B041|nr:50S ribosomal protein L11 methyltransferase [Paenibacillus senegalensis]
MKWYEVTVHSTEEAVEMISHFLHELGAGGVSIEESGSLNRPRDTSLGQWYELPLNDIPEGEAVIKGYFPEGQDMEQLLSQLKTSISLLTGFGIDIGAAQVEMALVDEEDWANAWKQYYKPIQISDRLTIKPTWEPYDAGEEEIVLELDPGMAFGTGTHATTALCLRTLDQWIQGGERVIDVGTGSGVLAIAAAKLGAEHVLALDLDPVAVSSATDNAALNGLEKQITVKESDLLGVLKEQQNGAPGPFKLPVDIVVANILADIILLFVKDVYDALSPGGLYVASGIITAKQDQVERKLVAEGFAIEQIQHEQDWVVIVARKQ